MALQGRLAKRARKAGLVLRPDIISGLEAYFELLRRWNRSISLTSLPTGEVGEEAIDRLLIEPLLAVKYLPVPTASLIDIGSGGGSPAIPIKLFSPGISMRMVESKTRKAAFLREVIRKLSLGRTVVDGARFEELLARPELHEAADVVTIRAVRVDQKTLMGLQAFLKPGGLLFLFRSGGTAAESELVRHPLSLEGSHTLASHLNSRLVVFKKSD